jgi:hypothetical protein
MEDFTLFRTFNNRDEIEELIEFIKEKDIKHKIEPVTVNLIPFFQSVITDSFGLFVKKDDFDQLEDLITSHIKEYKLDDHPLNQLSDDELMNILKTQDEWSIEDVLIARRLLKSRKINVTDLQISGFAEERLEILRKQTDGKKLTIISGFLFPVLGIFVAPLIGFIGMIIYFFSYGIGLNYMLDYKKLPNGEKVKVYNSRTRKAGLIIILWALVFTIGGLVLLVSSG